MPELDFESSDSFRPKKANLYAGVILGIGFVLGPPAFGLFLLLREAPPRRVERSIWANIMLGIIIVVGPLVGLFLLYAMKNLFSHQVDVGENRIAQ